MRVILLFAIAALMSVAGFQRRVPKNVDHRDGTANPKAYDGRWWLDADASVRSGFLNGVADYLTWTAHVEGFSATPEQFIDKITEYFRTHPKDRVLLVTDVWRKLEPPKPATKSTPGAEVWTNPHWYLNGLWWRQGTKSENAGFVEAYLWCARCYGTPKSTKYSQPVAYYVERVTGYIRSHRQADDEAVATILARFGDRLLPE